MIDVLDVILTLQKEKKDQQIFPDYVLLPDIKNEVQKRLSEEMNRLYKEGKIKYRETLNSKGVYVTDG